MRKGMNVLEIIFSLFVLIVVVLVLIKLFVSKMTLEQIETPIQDIKSTYNYENEYSKCKSLCDRYEGTCDRFDAVPFCLEKIRIDIDGDKNPGEDSQGGVISGIPFCEDGLYCFHILDDCGCGTSVLDADGCLGILCDYYGNKWGYSPEDTMKKTRREISWGSCGWDPREWNWKNVGDFESDEIPYSYRDPDTGKLLSRDVIGADYWWARARYFCDSCENLKACRTGEVATSGFDITLKDCRVDKTTLDYSCEITSSGTCTGVQIITVIDAQDNMALVNAETGIGTINLGSTKLEGSLDIVEGDNDLVDGNCMFTYSCTEPDKTAMLFEGAGKCVIYS